MFPQVDGHLNCFDLIEKGHYEVRGGSTDVEQSTGATHSGQPVRFSFHRPPSTAASSSWSSPRSAPTKTFVR